MTGHAIKASAVVGVGGRVEVAVPLPAGTAVGVVIVATADDGRDLLAAAESSTAFWDNAIDDEVWKKNRTSNEGRI